MASNILQALPLGRQVGPRGCCGIVSIGVTADKRLVTGMASAAGGVTEGNVGAFMLAANDIVAKLDKSRRDAAEAKSVEAAAAGVAAKAAAAAEAAEAEAAETEAAMAAEVTGGSGGGGGGGGGSGGGAGAG